MLTQDNVCILLRLWAFVLRRRASCPAEHACGWLGDGQGLLPGADQAEVGHSWSQAKLLSVEVLTGAEKSK